MSIRLGRQRTVKQVGCSDLLRLATWNCSGLTITQKQLCSEWAFDILGLTKTHDKGTIKTSSIFLPAEPAPENDRAAGVALLLSTKISKCVLHHGNVGSRIVYARIKGAVCNLFVICAYVPHSKHVNPTRDDILRKLDELLRKVKCSDCVILLGDFNSRLPRLHKGVTGRWCVHKRVDNYGGGEALLRLLKEHGLVAASTLQNRNEAIQMQRLFRETLATCLHS